MKQYKVIWFDDEYDTLDLLKEQASINGIQHTGFTNAADGIIELEKNFRLYDAVIVDGMFYNKPGQSGNSQKDTALAEVFRALDSFKDKKIIPSFILSGQISFTKEVNPFADLFKDNKVYDKLNDADKAELWADIKQEADAQEDTQVRHQFKEVFDSFENLGINSEYQNYIVDLIKGIKYNAPIDEMLYFAQLRKIMEFLFRKSEKAGLLHSRCIHSGEVNLSESSLFLAGRQTNRLGIICSVSHFPGIIAEYVRNIIFITGAAVHTEDEESKNAKLSVESLRKTNRTPFLIYSLVIQLMDVVIWFKNYLGDNTDIEKNKSLWQFTTPSAQEGDWIKGEITRIADNGYGTFQPSGGGKTLSVIPAKVKEFSLCIHQVVEVTTKSDNTGTKTLIENIRVV